MSQRDATDVRRHTDRIAALAEVDRDLHRPPICRLEWGTFDIFTGVLTSVQQTFTLFLEDGTPVRATLSCSFAEATRAARSSARELHSADVTKTRQVRRTDTLHSLAAEEYNDPSLWRHIARANGIVNPRELMPGTVLTIPKLRP
jgi:nucleoid-associated protein YgaU